MNTILLPTDFSANSLHAINYAIRLYGTEVQYILLHTYYTPDEGTTMLYTVNPKLLDDSTHQLEEFRDALLEQYGSRLKLREKLLLGSVAEGCRQMAKQTSIDLIVMGTRGASGLREVLVGSNTASTIARVDRPVLAVPEEAPLKTPAFIALASDYGGITDERVLRPLIETLSRTGAGLSIVHVQPSEGGGAMKATFDPTSFPHALLEVPHSFAELKGANIVRALEQYVEESRPDMLAMLEHQRGFFKRLFHRSATKRMAMYTKVPLLALQNTRP